ncbi:uncharacterized protein LOC132299736 isoform X3 [Cornus florida]|uniref:uncharacterized protein LOC132299736 isoform X3 n=1 Tax=Cornus florida TaxID=4283 RepID=UPI0028A209B5|nr:uncharacterized protein LOC132299736 isoform X3 [Cornus florida]
MLLDCRMGWAMCSFSVALCFCAFAFIIITSLIQFTSQKIKNYKAPFPLDAEKETIDGNGFPKVKEANLCNRRSRFLLNKQMGDIDDDKVKPKRIVFVTVGTTCFDALVKAVDTEKVKETLSSKGYTHLLIQMGRGSYLPTKSDGEDGSLVTDYFSFSSSIADHLRSASLVISHAVCCNQQPILVNLYHWNFMNLSLLIDQGRLKSCYSTSQSFSASTLVFAQTS